MTTKYEKRICGRLFAVMPPYQVNPTFGEIERLNLIRTWLDKFGDAVRPTVDKLLKKGRYKEAEDFIRKNAITFSLSAPDLVPFKEDYEHAALQLARAHYAGHVDAEGLILAYAARPDIVEKAKNLVATRKKTLEELKL